MVLGCSGCRNWESSTVRIMSFKMFFLSRRCTLKNLSACDRHRTNCDWKVLTPPVSLSLWCLCIRFPPTVANQLELLETMQCTSLPACLQKRVMSWDNLNHYRDDDADTNGSTDLEDRTSTAYFMCIPEILYSLLSALSAWIHTM